MHETSFSFSNLESPPAGTTLPAGEHQLRGWVMPKSGGHFADVRARIGDRIFPAVHGFPRADLAAHFQTGKAVALAEFYVVVDMDPGQIEVTLETLEISGLWTPFQIVTYRVTPTETRSEIAAPTGPLRWHEYGRALQLLIRARRMHPQETLDALAQTVVADIPHPRVLRHAHLPFHCHLDEPAAVIRSQFGRVPLHGYMFHESQAIKRIVASIDLQVWQDVACELPSPGAAALYPNFIQSKNCGLFGLIDVPAQLPNPVCLRLYAELEDGSLHLCSVQLSRLYTQEDEKSAYAIWTPTSFGESINALNQALTAKRIAVAKDEAFTSEIQRLAADFDLHAPRQPRIESALQAGPSHSSAPVPRRVLLVSHNLNLEGAPLFLLDYARYLSAEGIAITVLSPSEGPLRTSFEAAGAHVKLIAANPLFTAKSAAEGRVLLRSIAKMFDFAPFDLVVCNTFTTFWAVHAAKAAGARVLLYVHESIPPASFYRDRMDQIIPAIAEEAFALADCVSFTTESTRNYHLDYGNAARHRLTPGWNDLARIDAWRLQNPRTLLRSVFHLQPHELLVTNVGTVSDRKGQHIFARAVDLFHRRHPALAARTRFVMLGGRHSPFDEMLNALVAEIGIPSLAVHPETTDYLRYYAAADLTVCSSYEESSPRVVMEAMACETPLIASNVQGIPELVRDGQEATLIPAGNTLILCDTMARLLGNPERAIALAKNARNRVAVHFAADRVLPLHGILAREVAAGLI